jgi:iron-sulfur cluster assembly accessory protein
MGCYSRLICKPQPNILRQITTLLGVTVLVDNKALLSVLGSEMDYVEDKLSAQFVFNNPNVKESCGCGQSFMT